MYQPQHAFSSPIRDVLNSEAKMCDFKCRNEHMQRISVIKRAAKCDSTHNAEIGVHKNERGSGQSFHCL